MKEKLLCAAIALVLISSLSGCATNSVQTTADEGTASMFVIVEETASWRVVRHRDTGVMYATSFGAYNGGNFTLLVNADGSPMVWEP